MIKNKIDIIIVNWNGGQLIIDCIHALYKSAYKDFTVHIIDNGSTDDSCKKIPVFKNLHIYYMGINIGFGKACNEALKYTTGEFILLLNPDTKIQPETIKKAITFLNSHNDCAVYGCAQIDDSGSIMRTCGRFPNMLTFCNDVLGLANIAPAIFINGFIRTEWDHSYSTYVNHVMGSFYLIRRSVIDKIGFMDDRYFVYLEDLDLSLRIRKAGYKIFYDAENKIFHKGGGISQQIKAKRLFYSLHAKHEFIKKYFNAFAFIICDCTLLFISPIVRLLYTIITLKNIKTYKEITSAYLMLYKHLFIKKLV